MKLLSCRRWGRDPVACTNGPACAWSSKSSDSLGDFFHHGDSARVGTGWDLVATACDGQCDYGDDG